jgi:hypothetical protein
MKSPHGTDIIHQSVYKHGDVHAAEWGPQVSGNRSKGGLSRTNPTAGLSYSLEGVLTLDLIAVRGVAVAEMGIE